MKFRFLRHLIAAACIIVFSSTGAFAAKPTAADLQGVVDSAHAKFREVKEGANADYIPILATASGG
jgi:glutaminase